MISLESGIPFSALADEDADVIATYAELLAEPRGVTDHGR